MTKRIVVTGVGAVTPLGIGAKATWEGLLAGRSGIRKIQHWDASALEVQILDAQFERLAQACR